MTKRSTNVHTDTAAISGAPLIIAAGLFAATLAYPALAYVGPGAGLGVLGALLAILLAVLATVVGLVLWPVRALARWWKARRGAAEQARSTSEAPR